MLAGHLSLPSPKLADAGGSDQAGSATLRPVAIGREEAKGVREESGGIRAVADEPATA
jgi:hypothetical protein